MLDNVWLYIVGIFIIYKTLSDLDFQKYYNKATYKFWKYEVFFL